MNYMKKAFFLLAAALMLLSCGHANQLPPADGGEAINIGYGSITKDHLTASVSKVKVKHNEIVTYDNIYEYLQGRVPGVQVLPGEPPRVIVRGLGTISSATDPLFIVDGVEVQDLSYLNPNDVDSVEVIKDGTSAIYGVRGANGVILVTTKR